MRMKYALCFKLRAFGRKTTSYQIRMRLSFNGQRADVSSGWNLERPDVWDTAAELVKPDYVGVFTKIGKTQSTAQIRRLIKNAAELNRYLAFRCDFFLSRGKPVNKRFKQFRTSLYQYCLNTIFI